MKICSIILGVLLIFTGVASFFHPVFTTLALGKFVGILLIASAINIIISIFKKEKSAWESILAVIFLISGTGIFFNAIQAIFAVDTLVMIYAFFTLFAGISQIGLSFNVKHVLKNWWTILLTGILSCVLSLIIIFNPFTRLFVADFMVATEIIMSGITLIMLAYMMKKIQFVTVETIVEA